MKHKWRERHYVDLFSGSGKAAIRGSDEIVLASPLLAATVIDHFTQVHTCDKNSGRVEALRRRLSATEQARPAQVIEGDANEAIDQVLALIPDRGALTLAFIDPYGLHIDFSTIAKLSARRADLVVLLADNMDALRNWATVYQADNSLLDRFMGEPGWRELLGGPGDQAERLRVRYEERLGSLEYQHFAHERILNTRGSDIYTLVYASRSPVGLQFWNRAASVDERGQRRLGFD